MLLELRDVAYRYVDGAVALERISMTVETGDRLAILGANGSGKSTLLRILNGLIFPTSGVALFRGQELSERALSAPDLKHEFRRTVGFVFQNADAQLFNATVEEEIAFGPGQLGLSRAETHERTHDVMRFLGIEHLSERPPFRLSGGEKRKVAIASVLSMNPEVLIFDEPFLGLDPRSQAWLVRTITQLQSAGKTTIVATHTLDTLPKIADRALVLSEAHQVVSAGPLSPILADENLLRSANLVE
ncbi:MAG: ABC transporter ATP-binding protein [Fimbriimonas sp.]|nr:ABC transporter ATP-binding protein [Fimbriimonas sp.]